MKKNLLIVAKLFLTGLVLWWVFFHILKPDDPKKIWTYAKTAEPGFLFLGIFIFFVILGMGICRWQQLLKVQGIHLPWHQTIWIAAVGTYFNMFLLGATGGDVMKAWYVSQAAPKQKPQAILSIIVDRMIGLLGLFILASISTVLYLPILLGNPKTKVIAIFVLCALVGLVLSILLYSQRNQLTSQAWREKAWNKLPFQNFLLKLLDSIQLYEKHPKVLFITLGISLGVHVSAVLATWLIGQAIHVDGMGLLQYFVYCPLINAFAGVAPTPGGLGAREGAFIFFFSFQNIPASQATALSLLFTAGMYLVNATCGILYLLGKPKNTVSVKDLEDFKP